MRKNKLIIIIISMLFTSKVYSQHQINNKDELIAILCTNDSVAFIVNKGWIDDDYIQEKYYANFAKEFIISNYEYISPKLVLITLNTTYKQYLHRLAYGFWEFYFRKQFLKTENDKCIEIIIYPDTTNPEEELYKLLKYAYSNVNTIIKRKEEKGICELNDNDLFEVLNRPLNKNEKKEINRLKKVSRQSVKQYKKEIDEPIPECK